MSAEIKILPSKDQKYSITSAEDIEDSPIQTPLLIKKLPFSTIRNSMHEHCNTYMAPIGQIQLIRKWNIPTESKQSI